MPRGVLGILDMAETARCGKQLHRACRRVAVGLLALIVFPAVVEAADFNLLTSTSATVSGANVGGQSASLTALNQFLDVNYNRDVTPVLGYRLRFVGSANEAWTSSQSTDTSATGGSVAPTGEVTLSGLRYSMVAGARLREIFADASGSPSTRVAENYEYIRGLYSPELLPAFTVSLEHTGQTDDETPRGLDRETTRAVFGANYTLAQKLNFAYTFTNQTEENHAIGRRLESYSNVGNVAYADSFLGDRLSVDASYLITQFNATETLSVAPISGGAAVVPRVLTNAYSLTETNPTVPANSKVPPATYTTLTTSTSTTLGITAPLVVDQGGTPNLNQSIAFGLSPGVSVTRIRMTVSPRAGDPRPINQQAQGVTFQIFVGSGPNVNFSGWSAVPIVSVTLPTIVDPSFEITFGATSGGFLKIHVAGDTQQPVLPPLTATELSAFGPSGGFGGTGQFSVGSLVQTFAGGLTGRPLEALTLSAYGSYLTSQQDPSGRQDSTGTYSVTATGTPHPLLTATANYQNNFTDSNDPRTANTGQWIGSFTLSSTPLPTLTASLSGSRSENSIGGATQNRIDSISANTSLKPYRNLNTDVTVSAAQNQNFLDGRRARLFSAVVDANATLTDRLTGLFGYTLSASEVTGGPTSLSATTNSTFLQFTYTISRLLNANAQWNFSTTDGAYAFIQQYRLDLIPTAKTSVLLGFIRTDQSASQTSGSTNTASVNASWNISRYLDLNAFGSFTWNNTGDNVYTISATLSFRL